MSVKKVFKIIGIVLGCVTAFAGGVIGVMAIMGKFKTPTVKPERIYFENPEQVIVEQYKDDNNNDFLFNFTLVGENSSMEYPVNVTECLLWFKDGVGSDLIELCNKDGVPLVADNKQRYSINCNEKIYYKLKEVDHDVAPDVESEINGKVVLQARTADELHNSEKDLVIWIDRNVTRVFLNYGSIPSVTSEKTQTQRINVGVSSQLIFDYVVNPEISLQPISKENAKIIELYYRDPSQEDYVLVNLENIRNGNYNLYKIFDADETERLGKLVFNSDKITNGNSHEFKIAIFPTYQAREEYLSQNLENQTNSKRLEQMIVTDLFVDVVNTYVDKVSVSEGIINLQLHSQNDVIYASNSDAQDYDLNIVMQNNGTQTYLRYDELAFNAITTSRFYGKPVFVQAQEQAGVENEINFNTCESISYDSINKKLRLTRKAEDGTSTYNETYEVITTIKVDGYDVINAISKGGVTYYCNNGIAFVKSNGTSAIVQLLNAGSYLDFYIKTGDNYVKASETDIKYSVEANGSGTDKNWKIVIESASNEILDETKDVVIGLLVANSDGKFIATNLFAYKTIRISEEDLDFVQNQSNKELNYTLGGLGKAEEVNFNQLFTINRGSYTACVLAISEDDIGNAVVEYINAYFQISTKKYYIVGYVDSDGKFVNKVKAQYNAATTVDTANSLYLLQLKNGYDLDGQETAEALITKLINGVSLTNPLLPVSLDNSNVKKLHTSAVVSVNQKLLLDTSSSSGSDLYGEIEGTPAKIYEKKTYILNITSPTSPDLVKKLVDFYKIDNSNITNYVSVNYSQDINITAVVYDDASNTLKLTFYVSNTILENPDVKFDLVNILSNEDSYNLYTFKIYSSAPETIVYYYNGGSYIELKDNKEDANDNAKIVAKIAMDAGNNYTTTWYVRLYNADGSVLSEYALGSDFILNSKITEGSTSGFQDKTFKVENDVSYSIVGSGIEIVDNLGSKKLNVIGTIDNNTYLQVTISGTQSFVKVEMDTTGFTLEEKVSGNSVINGGSGKLSDLIEYVYNSNDVIGDVISLDKFTCQYAEDLTYDNNYDATTGSLTEHYFKNGDGDTILKITKDATNNDWKFERKTGDYSAFSINFDVITLTNTLNITITFKQAVTYGYNSAAWGKTLYQDTTVLLYEITTGDSFNYEPLIKIWKGSSVSDAITLSYGVNLSESEAPSLSASQEFILSDAGFYTIDIYLSGSRIGTATFTVIPNIVIEQVDGASNEVNSGSNHEEFSNFVKFYTYPTLDGGSTIIYGKTKNSENKILLYSNQTTDTEVAAAIKDELVFKSDLKDESGDLLFKKGETEQYVTTGWIEKIGETKEVVVTVTYRGSEIGKFNAKVKNNVEVTSTYINDEVLNIKAMTDVNNWLYITGKPDYRITKVEWRYVLDGKEPQIFANTNNTIPALNVEYENVDLLLTFEDPASSDKLSFDGKIVISISGEMKTVVTNIVPFELTEKTGIKAFSGQEFNLLTDVYLLDNISNIASIKVNSVKDQNGNSLTSSALGNVDKTDGLKITFNKINCDKVDAIIEYELIYVGGLVHTYTKEISLNNWEELSTCYPENVKDKKSNLGLSLYSSKQTETRTIENYEPVLINKNNASTISLYEAGRITAKNRIDNTDKTLKIGNIELYAYQNTINLSDYASNVICDATNGTITFPKYSIEFSGILVFKITSEDSGNYCYYYVNVYSSGKNTQVSPNTTETISLEYSASDIKTIKTIISEISDFETKYGVKTNYVNAYLLNATTLASDYVVYDANVVVATISASATGATTNFLHELVNANTLNITQYTKLELSLMCSTNGYMYPVGYLTIYLRPDGAPDSSVSAGLDLNNDENIYNGEFKSTIDANATLVDRPTTDYSIDATKCKDLDGTVIGNGIVNVDPTSSSINIISKVLTDSKFVVFYKHTSGYYIKVIYTYKAVEIPTGDYVSVGGLVVGSSVADTKFNTSITINEDLYSYFGSYRGKFKIKDTEFKIDTSGKISQTAGNTSGNIIADVITYIIDSDELTLEFKQTNKQKIQDVVFTYSGLSENNQVIFTFDIQPYFYVSSSNSDDSGTNSAQRKSTKLKNDYKQATGSYVEIKKEDITDGVKYSFGGYEIYVNGAGKAGKLEFNFSTQTATGKTFSDAQYVVVDNPTGGTSYPTGGTSYPTGGKVVIDDDYELDFVHLAKEYKLNATFYILNGSDYYQTSDGKDVENVLYLTISKTYADIEARYNTNSQEISGSVYSPETENVKKGEIIENLGKHLFENVPSSELDPENIRTNARMAIKKIDGNYITKDFSNMGFTDINNPNYISFNVQENATIKRDGDSQDITFSSSISRNTLCKLYMENAVGMEGKIYNFYIMANDKKDDIEFSNSGYVDVDKTYMSFVLEEANIDNDKSQEYTTGLLNIGSIRDDKGKGIFVKPDGSSSWKFLPKVENEQGKECAIFSDPTKGITYSIVLKANGSNYNIYFKIDRKEDNDCLEEIITSEISIHGSTDYILNEFEIVVFNTNISASNAREQIYGGQTIDMLQNNRISINGLSNVTLELKKNESKYGLGNVINTSLAENDNLISFDALHNQMKTYDVGASVFINAVFGVSINNGGKDYYVNDITYQMQLNRSAQFFFNSDMPEDDWKPDEVYDYTTKFVLTNSSDGSTYSMFKCDTSNGVVVSYSDSINSDDVTGSGENSYYKVLRWKLVDYNGLTPYATIVKNSGRNNPTDDIVTVSNTGIVFKKDYTGELNLKLTVTYVNGTTYSVNWTINVLGILTVNEQIQANGYKTNNGAAFVSGASINLIGSDQTNGIQVVDQKTGKFNGYITYKEDTLADDDNLLRISLEGRIVMQNEGDGETNEARFGSSTSDSFVKYIEASTDERLNYLPVTMTLPVVPSTTNSSVKYLVIYKIKFAYLGYETKEYYVAYQVVNNLNISVATHEDAGAATKYVGSDINVDTRCDTNNMLDLFYYVEEYNDGSTLTYTKTGYLDNNGNTITAENVSAIAGEITITDAGTLKTLTRTGATTYYYNSDSGKNYLSVFNLQFNNITEYKTFIDSIANIVIGEKEFTLTNIGDNGRLGIELSAHGPLFNNKLEDSSLKVVATSGQPIYEIPKYNAQTNSGLRMYGDAVLTAKGSKKVSELFAVSTVTQGYDTYKNYEIIGVGEPQDKWVNGADGHEDATELSGFIVEVPIINGGTIEYIEYKMYSVKYKDTRASGSIYSVSETFYIIKGDIDTTSVNKIYKVVSNSSSIVGYGTTELDLKTMVKVYANVDDVTNVDDGKFEEEDNPTIGKVEDIGSPIVFDSIEGNVLKEIDVVMRKYKMANPDKMRVLVEFAIMVDGNELKCSVYFGLPEMATLTTTSERTSVDIAGLYIPIYDTDGALGYKSLSSNLENVTDITELSSVYSTINKNVEDKYDGTISLNTEEINKYFESNPSVVTLEISYKLTTKSNGKTGTLNFVILVTKA